MKLDEQNILFFCRATQHAGTENVVVQLCNILKPYVNKIVVCSAGGFKSEVLNGMGIKHYVIPDIEKKSFNTVMSVLFSLNSIIKKEKITVIHTHHRMAAFYTAILKYRHKFYFINTAHNTFTNRKALTKFAYKQAHLISCGEMVKRNLIEVFNIKEDRVTVIHNAVEEFNGFINNVPEISKSRAEGNIIVGNIGRLSEQKGMIYFIQAAKRVLYDFPKVKFFIVGDGDGAAELHDMAERYFPDGNLIFLGYRDDVQNIMKQMDFIVLSSLWEGLPLTPIEAFSVGKPVVATAVDGTPEVVCNGKNGLLVESRNEVQLADAIIKLCQDKSLREQYGKIAYNTYYNEFSFDILSRKYIDFYKKVQDNNLL